jgi:hypothetical protein
MISNFGTHGPPQFEVGFTASGTVHVGGAASGEVINSFRVDDHVIAGAFQAGLPERLSDIVDVALAVYLSDRLCRRGSNPHQRYLYNWARHIRVTVPVRNPDVWSESTFYTQFVSTLSYLTEDIWEFEFLRRPKAAEHSFQQEFFPDTIRGMPRVALFSGGLDSLGGLCSEILDQAADTFVLFAGSTNFHHEHRQKRLAAAVAEHTGACIIPCVVPYRFKGRSHREGNRDEPTQRTRGFVHAALGAATAVMAGASELAVYENGVGAINLPYSGAQIGTQLTRAANPIALRMIGEFLSAALAQPFRVQLPFVSQTKGEILESIRALELGWLVDETNSCDRFLRQPQSQCGICTSCVLRRQSLHAAGLRDFDTQEYAADIYKGDFQIPERKLFGYRMMVDQVERLRHTVGGSGAWNALLREFPSLYEVAIDLDREKRERSGADILVSLYRRYCAEWDAFPARPPVHALYTFAEHEGTNGR